jgi:hypothetical protein
MMRLILTALLLCVTTAAYGQEKPEPEWVRVRLGWGIEPWHEKTQPFDAHAQNKEVPERGPGDHPVERALAQERLFCYTTTLLNNCFQ